jgi:thiamine biosynthesis lipoprotein
VRLDSGGLGKGLAADDVAGRLGHLARVAVDCCGDLRLGGRATSRPRRVAVADPVGAGAVAELDLQGGWGVATSGVTRRAWATDGRRAHHLLDPATGGPAWTGIVQVTAKAPTALEAEVRAKAALLAGPPSAADHLVHGGVVILEDGTLWVVAG